MFLLQMLRFKNAVLLDATFLMSISMKIPTEWKKMHEIRHKRNHTEEDVHTLIKRDDTLCGHLNANAGSHESKDCSNTPPLNSPLLSSLIHIKWKHHIVNESSEELQRWWEMEMSRGWIW